MTNQKLYKTHYTDLRNGIYVTRTLYSVNDPEKNTISFFNDEGTLICQSVTRYPEGSFQSLARAITQLAYAGFATESPAKEVNPEEMAKLFENLKES